jgi:predicted small lipoprotein YifL
MNPITAVLAIALTLAGCGEKPQRPAPESREAYNAPSGERPLHERTLLQGESGRVRD